MLPFSFVSVRAVYKAVVKVAKVEEADAAAAAAETAAAEIVPNTWHSIPSVVLVRPSRPAGLAASSRKPGDAAAAPAASSSSKRMPVVSRQDKIFCLLPCLYSAIMSDDEEPGCDDFPMCAVTLPGYHFPSLTE